MRSPQTLAVLLRGDHVATLERTRYTLRLTYLPEAQEPGATPLSLSLPPSLRTHTGPAVENYLSGLLPDSEGALAAIRDRYGADPRDQLSVLAAIGLDCAGAVQFCRTEEVDAVRERRGELVPISDAGIEQRLAELELDEQASWILPGEHWSLGGTQQKFTLRREGGAWFLPHGAEASTHIVKPGIRRLHGQALVEHVSMRAAATLGLNVARTEFVEFKSQTAIVSRRFDRELDESGRVRRHHQEDLCQSLGVAEKYEEYGGPSALEVIELLRTAAETPRQSRVGVDQFVDGLMFNTLIGAPDAHARNYAVLLDGDRVDLAPLYDVASGLAYGAGSRERELSMSIGGSFHLADVEVDAWRRFADQAGLDESDVRSRLARLAEGIPGAFTTALDEIDDWHGQAAALRERLVPELRGQVARFR